MRCCWVLLAVACGCGSTKGSLAVPPQTVSALAKGAFLFGDLGSYHYAVSTRSREAQEYFDQGLRLAYGFNHDEATRSFAHAAELDPSCAMCFWGVSLTLGPNYNVPMLPDRARAAWEALERARALAPTASPVERALIDALGARYKGPQPIAPPEQQPFNEAYAAAMRAVAGRFPQDFDVQVLFAEALMNVRPWRLWTSEGEPAPGTEEIVATLERVLAKNPDHPGANHYYIHAVEASGHPDKAVAAADRLPGLIPGAGHIVHMPAHIYQRVGRYADASAANRKAAEVDLAYMRRTTAPGYYPMYLGHNYGFLAYSAAMQGRADESVSAARAAVKAVPPEMLDMMPGMDFFASEHLLAMVRFGRWDEILAEPRPPEKYQVLTALWLHARGMALASTGKIADAEADLAALTALAGAVGPEVLAGNNPATAVIAVASKTLEARIAEKRRKASAAVALWTEAVALEDGLAYSEPADWFYPLRHFLGAALLDAKKPKEAEAVYRRDLERNPGNGWALYGLWQALAAQKRTREASEAEEKFRAAWTEADVKLARTAF